MFGQDLEELKAEKKAADAKWKKEHSRETGFDNSGYTDIEGNFHSVRDAGSGLQTGQTGVEGSGDVTLYSSKTNQHHVIQKGTGNESNSKAFIKDHNQKLRSHIMEDNSPKPSIHELKTQNENIERRHKETAERGEGYSGVYLSGDV